MKVFQFSTNSSAPAAKTYLGKKEPRTCRFCLPDSPREFRQKKHVIPEALGNKSLFSNEECDACNQRASLFENDLATHLTLVRLFSRIPGKATKGRGVEEFAHRFGKDKSHVRRPSFPDSIRLELHQGETTIGTKRVPGGFELFAKLPSYRLANVAKALVRMAVFVCDESDLASLQHCVKWLRGEAQWPTPIFWQTFVPKIGSDAMGLLLLRNVGAPDEPPYRLEFTYGGMFMGIGIPDPNWLPPKAVDLPNYGKLTDVEVFTELLQFKEEHLRVRPTTSVVLRVDGAEDLPALAHAEIAQRAYERYEERGAIHGHDVKDWIDAEQDLLWEQLGRLSRADAD